MKQLLKKIIDLIFYSNLWIALGALAMTWQTQMALSGHFQFDAIAALIFFATLFLYALHRIVGINRMKDFLEVERYHVIYKFRNHIIVYAALAAIGGTYYFFHVSQNVQLSIIIPTFLSLGYVIPFLSKKRRLRDVNHIKIFLIAIVWAWVTVLLPALEVDQIWTLAIWLMALERSLFIFAITLPFDIRDLQVGAYSQVKTIPAIIGIQNTKRLGQGILAVAAIIAFLLYQIDFYTFALMTGMIVSYFSTMLILQYCDQQKHDYYFTGLIDGTMLIQFILVLLFNLR